MSIKVILYDDNEPLRQSIQALLDLSTDINCMATFSDASDIERDISRYRPDVILMDIDMPTINGVQAVDRVMDSNPNQAIIMLTVFDDNENIFKALCAGASGYILKHYVDKELVNAIRMVVSGGAPMTGSIAKKVLQMLPKAKNPSQETTQLTNRESVILRYLAEGHSYKMIAAELENSLDTIRFHIKNI